VIASASCLRLFGGDEECQEFRPKRHDESQAKRLTIREVFERHKLPELTTRGRARATLAEYRCHLARWEEWAANYWITNPVVQDVKRAELEAFRVWLGKRPKASARTVNKHLGTIECLLATAAEHWLIDRAPKLEPLSASKAGRKLYLSYDQLSRLYQACGVAEWPKRRKSGGNLSYGPAAGWRALIVLLFNYGARTQEFVAYRRTELPALTWRQVSWDEESPADAGQCRCRFGWMWYTPAKQKRAKPDPLVLPLNEVAAGHLRSLATPLGAREELPVFDWPWSPKELYGQWQAIVDAAGVRPKKSLDGSEDDEYSLKHLRKTCATWHQQHSPGVAPLILGHAKRSVSDEHYVAAEGQILRAVLGLPQPEAFYEGLKKPVTDRQGMLF